MSQSVTALASEADAQRSSPLDFSLCAPAQLFSKELSIFRHTPSSGCTIDSLCFEVSSIVTAEQLVSPSPALGPLIM